MNYKNIMDKICDEDALIKSDFYNKLSVCVETKDKLSFINAIIEKYNCEFDDALIIAEYFIDKKPFPTNLSPQQITYNNQVAREWQNKPKCPTCGSANLSKVSATSKAVSVGLFGIFSQKVKKTWHCENCRYEW